MLRRRRRQREIAFSFDSFLDVVANVVGIILRLILVAWLGARSYRGPATAPALAPLPALVEPAPPRDPGDPREPLLARRQRELGAQQKALVGALARRALVESTAARLRRDLRALAARCHSAEEAAGAAREEGARRAKKVRAVSLTEQELRQRCDRLRAEVEALRKLPSPRQELRYRTPVSVTVQTHEMMFECKAGRVTLLDVGALTALIKRDARARAEELRTRWRLTATTAAVGAFRLRYTLEREQSLLSGPAGGPPADVAFRYGRTGWQAEPIAADRGEAAEQALADGSAFRKVIDALDPQATAVTMWVYPDSFPLYRRLRDYLHGREVVVAGRPLPEGVPIASSREGKVSRGQ